VEKIKHFSLNLSFSKWKWEPGALNDTISHENIDFECCVCVCVCVCEIIADLPCCLSYYKVEPKGEKESPNDMVLKSVDVGSDFQGL
jgi:hypothetical protein